MAQLSLAIGAILGFLAVALGAFGAHALKARLTPDLLAIWKTANEYHVYHALALVLVGLLARTTKVGMLGASSTCFVLGVLVFSGSLYLLALTGTRWLGAVTPFGGVLLLAGWALLAVGALRG